MNISLCSKQKNKFTFQILASILFGLFLIITPAPITFTQSSIDIIKANYDNEIKKKQEEIANITQNISQYSESLRLAQNNIAENTKILEKYLADISKLDTVLTNTITEIDNQNKEIETLRIDISSKESYRAQTTVNIYSTQKHFLANESQKGNIYELGNSYFLSLLEYNKKEIEDLSEQKKLVQEKLATNMTFQNDLSKQKEDLEKTKNEVESRIAEQKELAARNASQVYGLNSQINRLNQDIANLTAEQKQSIEKEVARIQAEEEERKRQQQEQSSNNNVVIENNLPKESTIEVTEELSDITIIGRGRDLFDGHGVGLSQWGAYGAGEKGIDYKTILTSYYSGTEVVDGYDDRTVNVAGYGIMNIEDYLAGLGEIPSIACKTDKNADKDYVRVDNTDSLWDCWPEETIKAQIVAARSYVLGQTWNDPNAVIATDATFQVYVGGTAKKWAAEATRGQVVTVTGQSKPIATYYSSSHRGHSESNEYVWTARSYSYDSVNSLKGYPVSYARGISDAAWAYQNDTYNFTWSTKSISKDILKNILKNDGFDIGDISNIKLTRGDSSRVFAVTVIGNNKTVYLTSWKFKEIINDYIENSYPSGQRDYVYSTEFDIELK